jgi:GNAT superfamily N-acetyltransferase
MRTMVADYEIDDDPGRIDIGAALEFLLTEAYWGRWRGAELIARQIRESWRVVGVYDPTGAMVGFARAFGDGTTAYLADVYVLSDHRGVGLGKAIVRAMIDDGPGADWRWMLHTSDAHGFYQQFGFAPPGHRYLERPRGGLHPGARAGGPETAESSRPPIRYGMAKPVLVRVQPY